MEDLDRPRVLAGAATSILNTLEAFGFEWDGPVLEQSDRIAAYTDALDALTARGLTFECSCSRSQLADEERYPGHCRAHPLLGDVPTAIRLRVDPVSILFADRIQGLFRQDVAKAVGDFVLRRRDGLFAYVLAVVVDDAAQGVSDVVRGADLLDNTPRQIHLQRLLGFATPRYAHVPVLTEAEGRKLAKSARSVRLNEDQALPRLLETFELLGLAPDSALLQASVAEAWQWAIGRWRIERVPKRMSQQLTG